jgi:hypothetical protein
MKPLGTAKRVKEWIPLSNFAIVETHPTELVLREHLLPFEGAKSDSSLIWGVYGTASINQAMFAAETFAAKQKKQTYTINMWYRIEGISEARNHLKEEDAQALGFIHVGRLHQTFRDSLLVEAHKWAARALDSSQRATALQLPLDGFMARYPAFARYLLRTESPYNMVVHPVRPLYDPKGEQVMIAVARYRKDLIMEAQVRFMEDIKVIV